MRDFDPSHAMQHLEGRFALISVAAEACADSEAIGKGFNIGRAIADLANDSANDCLDLTERYTAEEKRMSADRDAARACKREMAQMAARITELEALIATSRPKRRVARKAKEATSGASTTH